MRAAIAEPRVGPPLHIQLYVALVLNEDGTANRSAYLTVSGTQCLPQDAPASVIVTLDRKPGEVFTGKPNAAGRWSVEIPVDLPVDGVYVVNAECDNYFGTTGYPTATTNADDAISYGVGAASGHAHRPTPGGTPVDSTGGIANTGSRTATELTIGFGALAAGLLLVLVGRPRRAARPAMNDDGRRHRRGH